MTEIRISNQLTASGISQVMDVLRLPELLNRTSGDYPRHQDWLGETEGDLLTSLDPATRRPDSKVAFLSVVDRTPAGVVVYRGDLVDPETLHIRNVSIPPGMRRRELGRFMVAQVVQEAREAQKKQVLVDTKTGNVPMQKFLRSCGFNVLRIGDAYPGKSRPGDELDVVMVRDLSTLAA